MRCDPRVEIFASISATPLAIAAGEDNPACAPMKH
jgi:hypothetical protein